MKNQPNILNFNFLPLPTWHQKNQLWTGLYLVFGFLLAVADIKTAQAQTLPYSHDFEATDTAFHLWPTGDTLAWKTNQGGGVSGSRCLLSEYVTNSSGVHENDYYASLRLPLVAGNTYRFSFTTWVQYAGRRKALLAIHTSAERSGSTLLHDFDTLTATEGYQAYSHDFGVETTGSYHLIYYGESVSAPKNCYWYTDDLTVTLVNTPPTSCTLSSPANNSYYNPGQSVSLVALPTDAQNNLSKVEWYSGGTQVAEDATPDAFGYYSASFVPQNGGAQTITAKAIDSYGATLTSNSRNITVRYMPQVALTNLADQSDYYPGSQPVSATATDPDGTVQRVVFYVNGDPVGVDSSAPYQCTVPLVYDENQAEQTLTAKATDNDGLEGTQTFTLYVKPGPCSLTTPNGQLRQALCSGDSLMLVAEGGNDAQTLQWYHRPDAASSWEALAGADYFRLQAKAAGHYQAVWTYANAAVCTTAVDTVGVFGVVASNLCVLSGEVNSSISAFARVSNGAEPYQFTWTNNDECITNNCDSIMIETPMEYTIVTVEDGNGCISTDTADGSFYGKRMSSPSPATSCSEESNLLCNGGFEESVNLALPGGGSGEVAIENAKYWKDLNHEGPADYYRRSGVAGFNVPYDCGYEDGPFVDPDLISGVTNQGFAGIRIFGGSGHLSQTLNTPMIHGKKYALSYGWRAANWSEYVAKKIPFGFSSFDASGAFKGYYQFFVPVDYFTPFGGWYTTTAVFQMPYMQGTTFVFQNGIYELPTQSTNNLEYWYHPWNPTFQFGFQYHYIDGLYLAQLPEVGCKDIFLPSGGGQLQLNQNSTWIADFVANTGATFQWTPSTGLDDPTAPFPTVSNSLTSAITYACTLTISGVAYAIGTSTVHPASDQIIDLGTNPQNCCPIVQNIEAECALDNNSTTGKDITYQVTLTKNPSASPPVPFRNLYVNSGGSDFGTTIEVKYWKANISDYEAIEETILTGSNGGEYVNVPASKVNSTYSNGGNTAIFQITVNSNAANPTGAFNTLITTTSSGDPESCCRMAVANLDNLPFPIDPPIENVLENPVEWTVYPNPAANVLTVDFPKGKGTVSLFDAMGRKIKGAVDLMGQVAIPLAGLPNGIYQVRLETAGSVSFKKIVIRR